MTSSKNDGQPSMPTRSHVLFTPATCPCGGRHEGRCPVCDWGLANCSVCGQAEGTLEKFCPGPQPKRIPRLDFRDPTLAPSRLNQLDACPGYIGPVLEQDTDAMDEGTALHAAVELALKSGEIPEGLSPEHRDMVEWATTGFLGGWLDPMFKPNLQLEREITIPFCHNKARIDLMLDTSSDSATVVDWKFGRAKQAPADRNPQMRAYAVGLMQANPALNRVTLVLAYPRMQMHDTAIFTRADFIPALEELAMLKVKCDDYLNRLTPGEACLRCGRKLQCSGVGGLAASQAFHAPIQIGRFDLYDQSQLGEYRRAAGVLEAFCKEVKQWVDEAITKHGVEVPGFEVMERRGTRGLTDGVKALEMLPEIQREAGLPPEVDWARLVEGLGITLPKLESYLTEVLKAAHNGKPPRGAIKELTTKLTVGLNRLGLVKEGTPTVFVQEVKS